MILTDFPSLQFASPKTAIYQLAYVVPSLSQAVDAWTQQLHVGPFFEIDHWSGQDAVYHGQPAMVKATHLFSSTGGLSLELVHPEDDLPSVFQETIHTRGYGLQHIGYASFAFEEDTRKLEEQGLRLVFDTKSPIGPYRFFAIGSPNNPIFIELCDGTARMRETFAKINGASASWRGEDPLRSFTQIEKVV